MNNNKKMNNKRYLTPVSFSTYFYFISFWGIMLMPTFFLFSFQNNFSVQFSCSDQIRLVAQLCPTLCDLMTCSTPGLPVHHQFLEFTETHVHQVSDAIQPSHPLSSPSLLTVNLSQHQGLFK